MSIELPILEALIRHGSTLNVGLPVSWPNRNFTPPSTGRYLVASFIPNTKIRIGVSPKHRAVGLFQISVVWSLGRGLPEPMSIAGQIADHFPADLKLWEDDVLIRITKDSDVGGSFKTDRGLEIPVTVSWESMTQSGS